MRCLFIQISQLENLLRRLMRDIEWGHGDFGLQKRVKILEVVSFCESELPQVFSFVFRLKSVPQVFNFCLWKIFSLGFSSWKLISRSTWLRCFDQNVSLVFSKNSKNSVDNVFEKRGEKNCVETRIWNLHWLSVSLW